MFHDRRIVVVVPCYDVGDRLPGVLAELPAFIDHVIVVDDGSREPVVVAADHGRPTRVEVLRHEANRGLARAMETGFRRALDAGADVVVKVDGDGQMDPRQMSRLLVHVVAGQADIAKGNRLMNRRHLAGMPYVRLVGNVVLSFLTKLASGYWNIFDPTNGYLAIRRQVLEEIDLSRLGPGFFFETSLLCQALLVGAVVRDVAMPARYAGEKSSLSPGWSSVAFPALLAHACVRRITLQHFVRDFTPVALLLLAGGIVSIGGLWYGYTTWEHNARLRQATPPGTLLLIALPLVAGFNLLLQAFVMDINSVPTHSPWALLDRDADEAASTPAVATDVPFGGPRKSTRGASRETRSAGG